MPADRASSPPTPRAPSRRGRVLDLTDRPPAADAPLTAPAPVPRRTELDLAAAQLRAIARFNEARRMAQDASAAATRSREMRMDSARSLEVLRREHDALVARSHEQLRATGSLLRRLPEPRAVLAHRSAWFAGRVADSLQDHGVLVVASLDNGADVVGLAVAEQPELLLVEDTLAMVPGEQVVRDVRRYCPDTRVVAQAAYSDRIGVLLDAGASTVLTRSMHPLEVARSMLALVA